VREDILNSSGTFIFINMADVLNILVIDTHDSKLLGIADASTYTSGPASPTISITVPGFDAIVLPFVPNDFNIFNSATLGLSAVGVSNPLPDGIYYLTYSVAPALTTFVNKTIMRVDRIQEKFDNAFMKLDMMECDLMIKQQSKVELNSIYYFIQGSIAAANNCAVATSNKLYMQANLMLDNFIRNNCGCSGTNYLNNFRQYGTV